MKLPVNSIVEEMKDKPYTMLTILAFSTAVSWAWFNVAWASDVEKLQAEVVKQAQMTDKILSLTVANSIRAVHQQLCKLKGSSTGDRVSLEQLLEAQQTEYHQLTGTRYPVGAC